MGWAGGSELFGELIHQAKKHVPESTRARFYKAMIDVFENHDWDTQDECLGDDPIFDKVIKKLHPGWSIEVEDDDDDEYPEDT